MKVFLGVAFMGLMLIATGKINLNSEKKDKAVLKNKELNLWLGYIEYLQIMICYLVKYFLLLV